MGSKILQSNVDVRGIREIDLNLVSSFESRLVGEAMSNRESFVVSGIGIKILLFIVRRSCSSQMS